MKFDFVGCLNQDKTFLKSSPSAKLLALIHVQVLRRTFVGRISHLPLKMLICLNDRQFQINICVLKIGLSRLAINLQGPTNI